MITAKEAKGLSSASPKKCFWPITMLYCRCARHIRRACKKGLTSTSVYCLWYSWDTDQAVKKILKKDGFSIKYECDCSYLVIEW